MTRKPPAMMFYVSDWLGDPAVGSCSPATRGIWVDLLCAMWREQRGSISGSILALARVARCMDSEMLFAVNELESTNCANVTFPLHVTLCNIDVTSNVTLTSRRMERDLRSKESTKDRVAKFRKRQCNAPSNAKVTFPFAVACTSTASNALQKEKHIPPPDTKWIMDLWNEKTGPPLPQCQAWTTKRKTAALARLKDHPDRAEWETAFVNIQASEFCRGADGWIANIDFALRPDSLTKALEGNYNNRRGAKRDPEQKYETIQPEPEPLFVLSPEDEQKAAAVMAALEEETHAESFALWFKPTQLLRDENGWLVVRTPSDLVRNWLASHYMDTWRDAMAKQFDEDLEGFGFVVADETMESEEERTDR